MKNACMFSSPLRLNINKQGAQAIDYGPAYLAALAPFLGLKFELG